ncbi:MAG: hypothetical protein Ct9H300mP8_04470 [Gammaproteobacteria bacterium]|nr:MAG: hypothetical protein Ct9H300mP8_04470 [Gammaproteobacteria bacterium]
MLPDYTGISCESFQWMAHLIRRCSRGGRNDVDNFRNGDGGVRAQDMDKGHDRVRGGDRPQRLKPSSYQLVRIRRPERREPCFGFCYRELRSRPITQGTAIKSRGL